MLTVYGIETKQQPHLLLIDLCQVATVLTVHGIETVFSMQYLSSHLEMLQQFLPFTVLKRFELHFNFISFSVATVLTVHGMRRRSLAIS